MAMNTVQFLEALEEIEISKGISKETVIKALKEAMAKGFKKELGGDDADVVVNIDPENGVLEMCYRKDIVDEVIDDFLQVSKAEAKAMQKEGLGTIVEDKFVIPASTEDLRKATAMSIKSILKQSFAEEEKKVLFEQFKDKIDTMITGTVEKTDERGVSISLGKTSVFLPRTQLIGDERYSVGEKIRVYVSDVASGTKGAHIVVTRANEGFLKTLFTEEIKEIQDGIITIECIARQAGVRSKVAVSTNVPEVDPAGACIGQNGARIQKIVSSLGNGNAKEKIDIIAYSDNPGLYVIEALKPARVAGVIIKDEKNATAIVEDDSLSLAIGLKGVNARLAVRLTGYNIDIKSKSEALEESLEYETIESLRIEDMAKKAKAQEEARLAKLTEENSTVSVLPGLPEGYVAPQNRSYEADDDSEMNEAIESQLDKEETYDIPEVKVVEAKEEAKVEETVTPVVEETVAPVEVKAVKTTTTLEDLEKNLEEESKKKASKGTRKNYSRKKKEEQEEEEAAPTVVNDPKTYMSIYTEEELREMEAEDNEVEEEYDDDVDYDDYDDYYDDDDR